MSFLTSTPGLYGRTNHTFDMDGFGKALAGALGGTFDEKEEQILLADGLELRLYWVSHDRPTKIRVTGRHPRRDELEARDVPVAAQMPRIHVSFDRPIDLIARDVTRRVIEPAGPAAVALVEAIEKRNAATAELDSMVAEIATRFPALQIRKYDAHSREAMLYLNDTGPADMPYFHGQLSVKGSVHVERLGAMTHRRFLKVMEALTCSLDD